MMELSQSQSTTCPRHQKKKWESKKYRNKNNATNERTALDWSVEKLLGGGDGGLNHVLKSVAAPNNKQIFGPHRDHRKRGIS